MGNVRWTETAEEEWSSSPVHVHVLFQRSDFSDAFRVQRQNTVEVKFPLLVKSRIRASFQRLRDAERAVKSEQKRT